MSRRNCTHWWKVPAPHLGPDALSVCKHCGATRLFPPTLPYKWCPSRKSWRGQVRDMQDRLREAEHVQ